MSKNGKIPSYIQQPSKKVLFQTRISEELYNRVKAVRAKKKLKMTDIVEGLMKKFLEDTGESSK